MKIYISTVESLSNLVPTQTAHFDSVASNKSKIVVFYKDGDVVGMDQVAMLLNKQYDVELVQIRDRDDMLIMLGTFIGSPLDPEDSVAKVEILDDSIPVPARFSGRVSVTCATKAKPAAKRRTGGRGRKTSNVSTSSGSSNEKLNTESSESAHCIPVEDMQSMDINEGVSDVKKNQ